MIWTPEKPTREGYYWYKPSGDEPETIGTHICPDNEPIIVRYTARGKVVCLTPHMEDSPVTSPQQMSGQWCGPIKPPA